MDVPRLFRLWHDYTVSNEELMKLLDIKVGMFYRLREHYKLPKRPPQCWKRKIDMESHDLQDDPTPEEIAERAAFCRSRWTEAEEARRWQRGGCESWTPPQFHFGQNGILMSG